jgi:hypothetical protein
MGIYDKLRQEAKIDSRRFGKSIVCEILREEDLKLLYARNVVPPKIFLNFNTGLDPINCKLFAMPKSKYDEYQIFINSQNIEKPAVPTRAEAPVDKDSYSTILEKVERRMDFLQQNLVFVQLDPKSLEGKKAGLNPEYYGVLIDSIDVNQCVFGTYCQKNAENLRDIRNLND